MFRDIMLVLAGGGALAAMLKFIEFLIEHIAKRKDRKEDKKDAIGGLRQELKQHLVEVNQGWKEDYCDRHTKSIEELTDVSNQLKDNVIILTETVKSMKDYNIHVGNAVQGIIHDRMIHNVDCYIARGSITREELTTLTSMYDPYKALGGNGSVKDAYEIANDLPIVTKEEAARLDLELERKKFA